MRHPDKLLVLAIVSDGSAGGIDVRAQGRLGHDPAFPNCGQEIVLTDHAFAIADEVNQHLWRDRDDTSAAPKFAPVGVNKANLRTSSAIAASSTAVPAGSRGERSFKHSLNKHSLKTKLHGLNENPTQDQHRLDRLSSCRLSWRNSLKHLLKTRTPQSQRAGSGQQQSRTVPARPRLISRCARASPIVALSHSTNSTNGD